MTDRHITPRWKLALPVGARELMAAAAEHAGMDVAEFARVSLSEACARELGVDPAELFEEFDV